MRTEWPENEQLLCNDCAEACVICGDEYDEEQDLPMVQCENCDDWFHVHCLDEDEQPLEEVMEDEEAEWYCPECYEEYASDEEWAEKAIIDEEDMQADECFTRSECPCDLCKETNDAVDAFRVWNPKNAREQRTKESLENCDALVNAVMDNLHFRHGLAPPKN